MRFSDWQPTANLETLKERARILKKVRAFFDERNVIEVETPTLSAAAIPDPHLESFTSAFHQAGGAVGQLYREELISFLDTSLTGETLLPITKAAFDSMGSNGKLFMIPPSEYNSPSMSTGLNMGGRAAEASRGLINSPSEKVCS